MPNLTSRSVATGAGEADRLTAAVALDGSAGPAQQGASLAQSEAAQLRRLVAVCSQLSAMAAQQTDVGAVARVLAHDTQSSVAVLDRSLEILAAEGNPSPPDVVDAIRHDLGATALNAVLAAVAGNRRAITFPRGPGGGATVVAAPISVGEDVVGYLMAIADESRGWGEDLLLLASEHAAMVCGILVGRELVVAAAAGRARQELVEGLLLARDLDDGEAARWAQHLGMNVARQHAVMALSLADARSAASASAVTNLLTRLAPDVIVTAHSDEIVAVVPATDSQPGAVDRAVTLGRRCLAEARKRNDQAAVGVGNGCLSAAELSRSYSEARRALSASTRRGRFGEIALFAELGIHQLLVRFPDVDELREFAHEVLGRLLDEEQSTGIDYVKTMSLYFEENRSPSRAAERLHVHPNTVSHRIRRIEGVTGLSLDVQRDRLMAEVAVEILGGWSRA